MFDSYKKFAPTLAAMLLLSQLTYAEPVNINTADAATIDRVLVNVGPAKAQAIVDYRKQHGAFRSPEELAMVKGIGLKTVEKNRDRIVVAPARAAAPAAKPVATAKR